MTPWLLRMPSSLLWKRRVLACREVIPMIPEFLDRELDPEVMGKIREHLEVCYACRRFLESLEKTSLILRLDPSFPIPEEAAWRLMADLWREHRRALEALGEKTSE